MSRPPDDASPQPDQIPRRWDHHVASYEEVFEPLTDRFAARALDALSIAPGARLIDVAAGAGGAALLAAARGAVVTAVDASVAMAARAGERGRPPAVDAVAADAAALPFAEASFDAALSVFGLILCPDPARALREAARVVAPGGRIAVVTWTEPERYELASRLSAASLAVCGPPRPSTTRPAQLRFTAEAEFRRLFLDAGLEDPRIGRVETRLEAPSARWLAERLAFAPGLGALLASRGEARERIVERFVADLERDQGVGAVALTAVAFVGTARKQSDATCNK